MSEDDLKKLVDQLEITASTQPKKYLCKVTGIALLGYVYIFFVIILLLAILGLLVWISLKGRLVFGVVQLGLGTLAGIFIILKSFNVKLQPPNGISLSPEEAPELWTVVTQLADSAKAPKVHKILLVDEFNAAALEFPRFGIFGGYQNYVLIGLPLMLGLKPEQFKAVIAHELGHLSGQHSKISCWIYRQRVTWSQIMAGLETSNQFAHLIFARFCQWYIPFFNAYSFVLARMQEYEADRLSILAAGPQSTAGALLATAVKAQYLDAEFWPKIAKMPATQINTPDNVISLVRAELTSENHLKDAARSIKSVLAQETDASDTHPCMHDRIKTILSLTSEIDPESPVLVAELDCRQNNAAREFLGTTVTHWEEKLNKQWQNEHDEPWKLEYERCQNELQELSKLEEKHKNNALTSQEKGEFAALCTYYRGQEEGLALTEELAGKDPDNAGVQHNLGLILLRKNIEQGIHHLERAITIEPSRGYEAYSAISHYLRTNDRKDEASDYDRKAKEYRVRLAFDYQERMLLTETDTFTCHDFSEETLSGVKAYFENIPKIKYAYLVKKDLKEFPETPMYLLILDINHHFFELETEYNDQKLVEQVAAANLILSWHLVISMQATTAGLRKMLKEPGILIFDSKQTHMT